MTQNFEDASSWYGYSNTIDKIRKENFARLDGVTFLDAAGTPPYCEQAVRKSNEFLSTFPLSNPHSNNVTSIFTTNLTNHVRSQVLKMFNTDSDHYSLIFTHNTSHSCFLLADAFPWKKHLSMCAYFQEAHHSLLGMRHTALSRRAITIPMTLEDHNLIKKDLISQEDEERDKEKVRVRKDVRWNDTVLDDIFEKIYSHKSFLRRYQDPSLTQNELKNKSVPDLNRFKPGGVCLDPKHEKPGSMNDLRGRKSPLRSEELPIDPEEEFDEDELDDEAEEERTVWNLLTVSLESNFNGEKFPPSIFQKIKDYNQKLYPLRFSPKASSSDPDPQRKNRKYRHQWKIFVDAAAYVPSAQIDLSEYPIDFLAFSFSKVFGFPTGLGALLIKKDIMEEMDTERRSMRPFFLRRNFFSGGTVLGATSSSEERHFWHTTPSYCYIHDSSYFSLSAFSSSPALLDQSPSARVASSAQPTNIDDSKRKQIFTQQILKKERLRRREKEREKERKARNYLSDLELDRQFEDGTIPYTSIIPLGFAFSLWSKLFTDFATIQKHTYYLSQYLYLSLKSLKYTYPGESLSGSDSSSDDPPLESRSSSGSIGVASSPFCEIYGNHHLESPLVQGPIVSFNILHPISSKLSDSPKQIAPKPPKRGVNPKSAGEKESKTKRDLAKRFVPHKDLEEKSKKWNICLRSGAFCNTGSAQTTFQYSERKYKQHLQAGGTCTESTVFELGSEPYGAVRVSLSYMSNKQDVDHFIRFLVVEYMIPLSPGTVPEPYASWSKSPIREGSISPISVNSLSVESIFSGNFLKQ